MRIIVGALWLVLFVVLFAFAVNNTAPVELHFFAGMSVKAPLIALLLAFFVGGFFFGFVALMPTWVRQRVALRRLRREQHRAPDTLPPSRARGPQAGADAATDTASEIQAVARGARTTT